MVNGATGKLKNPALGGNLSFYKEDVREIEELKELSDVWKTMGDFTCAVCDGTGHIEVECGTKHTLDKFAKSLGEAEKTRWGQIKFLLYY